MTLMGATVLQTQQVCSELLHQLGLLGPVLVFGQQAGRLELVELLEPVHHRAATASGRGLRLALGLLTLRLRFPGQYFDEETGLHENWNRYYDPSVGRYISPEPLLSSPKYVAGMVHSGSPPSTYAYALGNPTGVTERDGRVVIPITVELPNGKHSTCSESVKKLIAKMMRSVETSKNCRCKRLFEDKDASQGGTSLADKLLSEELVYSLAC